MPDWLPAGTHEQSLDWDGRQRKYVLHIPEGEPEAAGWPVVFAFHGAGGTSRIMLYHGRWLSQSEHGKFIVVAPEGTPHDLTKKPNFRFNPQLWNLGGASTSAPTMQADDVGFIKAILESILTLCRIDPDRCYATGFSNGGGLTFRLGAELGDYFAALAPVACYPTPHVPSREIPTWFMVGDLDPLILIRGGDVVSPWTGRTSHRPPLLETLTRWAEAIGCNPAPREILHQDVKSLLYEHAGTLRMVVQIVQGLGHHWPGGKDVGVSKEIMGPLVTTSLATELIWKFFASQRRGMENSIPESLLKESWARQEETNEM